MAQAKTRLRKVSVTVTPINNKAALGSVCFGNAAFMLMYKNGGREAFAFAARPPL
ncbi:MAG: hypothetical protein PHI27_00860 [Eubacteriales bacterium]|nr:hypothetical protein [Eubacteriales bacterium]MDD4511849.1 hypothetical protein [Eubacteriales bacterium]